MSNDAHEVSSAPGPSRPSACTDLGMPHNLRWTYAAVLSAALLTDGLGAQVQPSANQLSTEPVAGTSIRRARVETVLNAPFEVVAERMTEYVSALARIGSSALFVEEVARGEGVRKLCRRAVRRNPVPRVGCPSQTRWTLLL